MASSPRRASMWARRVDQRWFSRGSTPTISRIGRFAGSVPGRSANRTPKRVAEVLLERGVVGLRRGNIGFEQHPAVDGQPASVEGLHLVRHRNVGVQVRVAGPAVPVGERGRDQASDVDLPDALRPGPGEQGMLLDERQRVLARRPDGPVRSQPPPPDRRPPTRSRPTSPGRTSGHNRQLSVSAAASLSRSVPPAPEHQSAPGHARPGRTHGPPRSAPAPDLQPAAARRPAGRLPY